MSTLEEQVEGEQAEYEREEEDAHADEAQSEPEEVEPEPEPEPEGHAIGPDELRKAERAIDSQRKKLAGILGDDYVSHDCVLCGGIGFVPELPPIGTTFTIEEGEAGPVLRAEAPLSDADLLQAPDKGPCDECGARGFVLTGSKNPNAKMAPCSKCSGNGWVQKAREVPMQSFGLAPNTTTGTPSPSAVAGMGPDAWGRAAGHPHWGVPPASIPG